LKPTGSLFFHCDTNASHIIRCLLDNVLGPNMFRAEIIWHYRRWSNSQRCPLPSHQTIFFYSKTEDYKYNQQFSGYSPSTNIDQILQLRKRDKDGRVVYARDEEGQILINGNKKGVPLSDVWDIPFLNPKAKERSGYPTQKPILLLERIISLTTDEGDVVLDPFCGSGTTLVASKLLNRRAIGIDISSDAVKLTLERINNPQRTDSALLENGRESYEEADEEILQYLYGLPVLPVQRNRGIDAILPNDGGAPILIRIQRPNESIQQATEQLIATGRKKQPAIMVLVVTNNEITETQVFFPIEKENNPSVLLVNSTSIEILKLIKSKISIMPQQGRECA